MSCELEEPRYYRMSFRVTPTERRRLTGRARRAGLEFSAYARALLLNVKPPRAARRPMVETVLLAQTLARLGTIAATLHRFHRGPITGSAFAEALEGLRDCRERILAALGRKARPA